MADTIVAALGRDALIRTVSKPFAFFRLYSEAARKKGGDAPVFSTKALAGNWTMARAAFEKILAHPNIDPGRHLLPFAQLELARTLARAGDVAGSRRTYEQLFERWKNADPDLPVLGQARQEYQSLAK